MRFGAPLASSPRARPLSWGAAGWTSPTPGLDSGVFEFSLFFKNESFSGPNFRSERKALR